jgi:hypothetical protein
MRKPAAQSCLFLVPRSGLPVPSYRKPRVKPGSQRFVQVPFDFESLPDADGGDDASATSPRSVPPPKRAGQIVAWPARSFLRRR